MLIQSDIVPPRQVVDNLETDIMPRAVVLESWSPQANDDFHTANLDESARPAA